MDDANALNAAQGNYTNYTIDSYADIVDAIHTVQTEMGITGTTQLEASTTIQGSIASMKAAYENFITGLGDENADMAELTTNLLGSTVTVAENLLPVVEKILKNIGVVVQEKGPEMIEKFVGYAVEKLPQVIELGMKMVLAIASGLAKNLPQIVRSVLDMMATIVKTFVSSLPDIVDVGKQIVKGLWEGIKAMAGWLKNKVTGFVDTVKGVFTGKDGFDEHSPSKWSRGVFRYVMEGGAEGLDDGLPALMRGVNGVTGRVKSGMDFGTASVGFADSGIGISSAAIVNSMGKADDGGGSTTLNLMLPDGTKLATYTLPFLIRAAAAAGTPIANPQTA